MQLYCPHCGNELIKNGRTPKGSQRWRCDNTWEHSDNKVYSETDGGRRQGRPKGNEPPKTSTERSQKQLARDRKRKP